MENKKDSRPQGAKVILPRYHPNCVLVYPITGITVRLTQGNPLRRGSSGANFGRQLSAPLSVCGGILPVETQLGVLSPSSRNVIEP